MKRALLLEDGNTCAAAARAELVAHGFRVVHQRSAKAAKAACLTRFALYLVDVSVPASERGGEGDGLAFVAWLRAREPAARVVVWSAQDHYVAARALGAMFIRKDGHALAKLRAFLADRPAL